VFSLPSLLYFWAVGPSALPCAGAAPPQRPPTKTSLTDRVHSSQPVGWRAWLRLNTTCVTKSLHGSKDDWLVRFCGLVVTYFVSFSGRVVAAKGSKDWPFLWQNSDRQDSRRLACDAITLLQVRTYPSDSARETGPSWPPGIGAAWLAPEPGARLNAAPGSFHRRR